MIKQSGATNPEMVGRLPKSVFRPIYFVLMLLTLFQIGREIFHQLFQGSITNDLFAAFVGDHNVDSARMIVSVFVCVSLFYFLLVYVIFEGYEDGVGAKAAVVRKTGCKGIKAVFDFIARFAIVSLVIFGPEAFGISHYVEAWRLLGVLAATYAVWSLILLLCFKADRSVWWDVAFGIGSSSACYLMTILLKGGDPSSWALLILLVMAVVSLTTAGFSVKVLAVDGPKIVSSAWKFLWDWGF